MKNNFDKPLCCLDIETTGLEITKDKIVSVALVTVAGTERRQFYQIVNPERPIPKEASDVHGITDELVKGKPIFSDIADEIVKEIGDSYLVSFNGRKFDIPFMDEELRRCGRKIEFNKRPHIDVSGIFKKKEERTLTAGMKFYCGKEMTGAHNALNDVNATLEILAAQLERYEDIRGHTITELSVFSDHNPERVDLDGKLVKCQRTGEIVYNIGKVKGVPVRMDRGFGEWMLRNDFTAETKERLRELLNGNQQREL